jgi:hypothetical protein
MFHEQRDTRHRLRRLRAPARTLLLCLALLLAVPFGATAEPLTQSAFSVLSYNVHGLPAVVARDDPSERSATIGWLANRYNVVLFQEDFEYHSTLRRQMLGKASVRGPGIGSDVRRILAKILLFPIAVVLPHFSPPYGAGITALVDRDLLVDDSRQRKGYGVCDKWFDGTGDCWANKGYLKVSVGDPRGWQVDVYNTHLEAGGSAAAVRVRRRQLDLLARAIEKNSAQRAVIVAGDFNITFSRPGDRESIEDFRNRLALLDSSAGPELPFWQERDYILYRSSATVPLAVVEAGEAVEFVNNDRALSDHPALAARFSVQSTGGDEQPE